MAKEAQFIAPRVRRARKILGGVAALSEKLFFVSAPLLITTGIRNTAIAHSCTLAQKRVGKRCTAILSIEPVTLHKSANANMSLGPVSV